MPEREADYRPAPARSPLPAAVVLVVLAVAAFFGWRWWQQQAQPAPVATAGAPAPGSRPVDGPQPPGDQAGEQPAPPAEAPDPAAQLPAEGAARHRIDAIAGPETDLPALAQADGRVREALADLLGTRAVAEFLQLDGFVRRVVATVDNLPREHAAPALWPVQPAHGRIALAGEGELRTLAAGNSARYAAFVRFVESVDAAAAARAYARLYPLFQQAYEELGYPGRYFNDRLVAVIDHLLLTPEPQSPVAIRVVEVRGEIPAERPWVRYEYADARLQALSAGQKLLVRVGPENAQRLKAALRAWRAQVATAGR